MSVGDALGTPQIMLGLPVPDCNLLAVDVTYGLKYNLWTQGSDIETHIKAMPVIHPDAAYDTYAIGGNRYGAGRSIYIGLDAQMRGTHADPPTADQARILSAPTPYAWIPGYGTGMSFYPHLLLTHSLFLETGQTILVKLQQFNSADTEIDEDTIATLTPSDNTTDHWVSYTKYGGKSNFRIPVSERDSGFSESRIDKSKKSDQG